MKDASVVYLPTDEGHVEEYVLGTRGAIEIPEDPRIQSRIAYAASHVVGDTDGIDWDATMAFRRHLWSLGLGVAEAMDTAQRGSGLSPALVDELISHTAAERPGDALLVCGVGTDALGEGDHSLDEILAEYFRQAEAVETADADPVIMASRALARTATNPDDYMTMYTKILDQCSRPVIIHWLGPMFDPSLAGYWGSHDGYEAMTLLVDIVAANADAVDGVKISMLDADLEREFRRRLPEAVRTYTGDDFNYVDLIEGDDEHYSDALLGIFDAVAPAASAALVALDRGDVDEYRRVLEPTVALSRRVFEAPTLNYKTGLVFLAYLAGHQSKFSMLAGHEANRSIVHLSDLVRLADVARLFADPVEAARRTNQFMSQHGVDAS